MRVLYDYEILWLQKHGGISRYFYELISRLDGCKDVEWSLPVKASDNEYFPGLLQYKDYPKRMGRILNELATVKELLRSVLLRRPFDLIHMTFYLPLIWPLFVNWRRTRLVITVYDMTHERFIKHDRRLIRAKRKWIERADTIITISEFTKNDLLSIYPETDPSKIEVIYLGSGLAPEKCCLNPACIMEDSGDGGNDSREGENAGIRFLYVGERKGYKNFKQVIRAFAILAGDYTDAVLCCMGGGPFDEAELKSFEGLKVSGRVIQADVTDDELAKQYRRALCMIFPSLYEGFGIPILEAWSFGCPVLLCNSGCFPEIAGDGAAFFERGDSKGLARLMVRMLNRDERKKLIDAGYKNLKRFSFDRTCLQTVECYRRALKRDR